MLKSVWFDITNTPQVHFLLAVRSMLCDKFSDFLFSVREFSETISLIEKSVDKSSLIIINSSYGTTKFQKAISLIRRFCFINARNIEYDLSISCGSDSAIWHSFINRKKSIAFGDNDTAKQWTYSRFVDFAFFPDAIDPKVLNRQGLKNKFHLYHGFKEDIYLSYFKPDDKFMDKVPYMNYVVLRPENIHANYLNNRKVTSIVPKLLSRLLAKGLKVIFLPRYDADREYAKGLKNVFIPAEPLNGLDLCFNADAVLTGAGTFAREAACLGVPSFSFYAGKQLLAVDKKLINDKKMIHSRDPDYLVRKVLVSKKNSPDIGTSVVVREELKEKLIEKIDSFRD